MKTMLRQLKMLKSLKLIFGLQFSYKKRIINERLVLLLCTICNLQDVCRTTKSYPIILKIILMIVMSFLS